MKMASLVILIPPIVVLGFTALAVVTDAGKAAIFNPGAHGFSEILYAFSSQGNNNGSAFAGLGVNNPFYNLTGGFAMRKPNRYVAQDVTSSPKNCRVQYMTQATLLCRQPCCAKAISC